VYLCPTRQLVNQVAEQANDQYGLRVDAFVGSAAQYDASAKSAYQSADRLAVTTYSSLFNSNPYFKNAHLLLLDDAHAADNYISETWSLRISRTDEDHKSLHAALAALLRPVIGSVNHSRLIGDWAGISDYLADKDRRKHLDPELQAEIEFGVQQSRDTPEGKFVEYLNLFLANDDEWEEANEQIIALRAEAEKEPFPARDVLAETVPTEIDYQTALWQGDYEDALGYAETVIGRLVAPDLRGYRALWHYLAGSAPAC